MIQLLNPIPGSPIYKKAVKENLIEIDNLSLYNLEHCVMPTKYLSRQQLGELTGGAFQSFYSKPGRFDRILNGYTSPYVKMKFLSFKNMRPSTKRARPKMPWPSSCSAPWPSNKDICSSVKRLILPNFGTYGPRLQVWKKRVLGIIVIAEPAARALCDLLKIALSGKPSTCWMSPGGRASSA